MKTFIGVKMIQAEPMTHGQYSLEKYGEETNSKFSQENKDTMGYKVIYDNDYVSWSPKEVFEAAYFPISEDSKISEEDVVAFMGEVSAQKIDAKTTLVSCESKTGFTQHETSACVDPANYDEELGKKYGTEALKKKYWHCLGFVLQWAKNGLK